MSMNLKNNDAVQLLINTGLITLKDATQLHSSHEETVLEFMLSKQALLPEEINEGRKLLTTIIEPNQTRKLKAKMSLVNLITKNLNRRITNVSHRAAAQRKRITSDTFPAIKNTPKV